MMKARLAAFAVVFPVMTTCLSAQTISVEELDQLIAPRTESEPRFLIQYTAELTEREGEAFFELKSASEFASAFDELAQEGFEMAFDETASFLAELPEGGDQSELSLRATASGLVWETINGMGIGVEQDWSDTGLAVGYYSSAVPSVTERQELLLAMRDWAEGTAFIYQGEQAPAENIFLAQYNDDTIEGLNFARMRRIAEQATNEMFSSAAETACRTSPRPREISPSISVSFSLFAGAEFAISATYLVEDLCRAFSDE